MKIKCHQAMNGHFGSYSTNAVKSDGFGKNCRFDYCTSLPGDKKVTLLELRPVLTDKNQNASEAVLTRIAGDNTPFTHFLLPDTGNIQDAAKLMYEDLFATEDEFRATMSASQNSPQNSVGLQTVEKEGRMPETAVEWNLNEEQNSFLAKISALYWMKISTGDNNPLVIILRNPATGEILSRNDAVATFFKEIVTMLPEECRCLASAAFLNSARGNVRIRTCCALFPQSQQGEQRKDEFDIVGCNTNAFNYAVPNRSDREMLETVAIKLNAGEECYPEYYRKLQGLKGSILPQQWLTVFCLTCQIEKYENSEDKSRIEILDKCCKGLFKGLYAADCNKEMVRQILRPLCKKIISAYDFEKINSTKECLDIFNDKSKWLTEKAEYSEAEAASLLDDMAVSILNSVSENKWINPEDKVAAALAILPVEKAGESKRNSVGAAEKLLAENFEMFVALQAGLSTPVSDISTIENVVALLGNLKIRSGQKFIENSNTMLEKYPDISDTKKERLLHFANSSRLQEIISTYSGAKTPDIAALNETAYLLRQISKGTAREKIEISAFDFLLKNYIALIKDRPQAVAGNSAFLDLAKKWLNERSVSDVSSLDADELKTVLKNITRTLESYDLPQDEIDKLTVRLRTWEGRARLNEIAAGQTSESEKVVEIANLRSEMYRTGVLKDGDSFDQDISKEINRRFLSWEKADKPFAYNKYSGSARWFMSVAEKWLSENLPREELSSAQLESLEKNISAAINDYTVSDDEKDRLLANLRRMWAKTRLDEIYNDEENAADSVLASYAAYVHAYLKNYGLELLQSDENQLTDFLSEKYIFWSQCNPPFACGENNKNTDNELFLETTEKWVEKELPKLSMNSSYLGEVMEKIKKALNFCSTSQENKFYILSCVTARWGAARIDEIANDPQMSREDKAIWTAECHNRLKAANALEAAGKETEAEMHSLLLENFVQWDEALPDKPFASTSDRKYSDDYFVTIAKDWFSGSLVDCELASEQIKKLESDAVSVLKKYNADADTVGSIQQRASARWCAVRFDEVTKNTAIGSMQRAEELAEIYREPLKIRIFEGEAGYICIFVCIETSHFCLIGQKWLVLFTLGLLLPAFQALFLILGMVIPCTSLLILFFAFQ